MESNRRDDPAGHKNIMLHVTIIIIYSIVLESALTKAMEEGGGKLNPCTITLHGPPGVGKTSLKRVILGQPPLPKEKQNSTNIMENPARAISTNRLTAAGGQLLMEVNNMEFIKMLAKNVESLRRQEPPQHDPIPVSVICNTYHIDRSSRKYE